MFDNYERLEEGRFLCIEDKDCYLGSVPTYLYSVYWGLFYEAR